MKIRLNNRNVLEDAFYKMVVTSNKYNRKKSEMYI